MGRRDVLDGSSSETRGSTIRVSDAVKKMQLAHPDGSLALGVAAPRRESYFSISVSLFRAPLIRTCARLFEIDGSLERSGSVL